MMKRIVCAMLLFVAAPLGAADPGTWRFEKGGLSIVVVAKYSDYSNERSYQIVVGNALRPLARLEVNRDGLVTDAWLTDLDRDGAFEIVVATGQLDGAIASAVDVHEWQEFRFASSRTAELSADQRVGYQGNDQFEVKNDRLRRAYPVFAGAEPARTPTGKMAHFEYRYAEDRWKLLDE